MKVFLGGTCADSNWRKDVMDKLDENDIDYFNPVVEDWNEEAQNQEIYEREHCDICLYGITPLMQGVYSIAEVVDDVNKRPNKTILLVYIVDNGKFFDEGQLKSLKMVADMVKLNGGCVFYNNDNLVEHLINLKDVWDNEDKTELPTFLTCNGGCCFKCK